MPSISPTPPSASDSEGQDASPQGDVAASMRPAFLGVAITALVLTAAAFALFSRPIGMGVALGGSFATANLWIMKRVARAFIAQKGAASWAVVAAIKLLALIGAVWWVLKTELVPGMALFAGYVALPLGITLGTLFGPPPPDA